MTWRPRAWGGVTRPACPAGRGSSSGFRRHPRWCRSSKDARRQYQILSTSTDADGTPMVVTKLQGPDYSRIRSSDVNFVAAYANYYVCNGAVISAQFGDTRADAGAKAALQRLFPGRTVEQLDIDSLGAGGGGIHCVTQQQPRP
nr:agmatine deiminase family protein [Streptomyces sp. AcE210]